MKNSLVTINNEAQLERLFADLDDELAKAQVQLTQRVSRLLTLLEERLNLSLPVHPPRRAPQENNFAPVELSIRAYQWLEKRYGARIHKPFAIGYAVVWIRGAFYRLHIPLQMADDKLKPLLDCYGPLPEGVAPTMNLQLLHLVEDLTPDMAKHIGGDEVLRVAVTVELGMKAFGALRVLRDIPLMNQCAGDLAASAHHLMQHHPQFGLSRFASLQATEKALKAFIKENRTTARFSHAHDLSDLCDEAGREGLTCPPRDLIDAVQCEPGVRYNEPPSTDKETLLAHFAALQIVGAVAQETGELLRRPLPDVPTFSVEGIVPGRRRGERMLLHEFAEASVQVKSKKENKR